MGFFTFVLFSLYAMFFPSFLIANFYLINDLLIRFIFIIFLTVIMLLIEERLEKLEDSR